MFRANAALVTVTAVLAVALSSCGKSSKDTDTKPAASPGTGSVAPAVEDSFTEGLGNVTTLPADGESQAFCEGKDVGVFAKKQTDSGFDYYMCVGKWPYVVSKETFTAINLAFNDYKGEAVKRYAGFFTFKRKVSAEGRPDFGLIAVTYVDAKKTVDVNYIFGYEGELHIDVASGKAGLPFKFKCGVDVEVKSATVGTVTPVGAAKAYNLSLIEAK